MVPLWYYRLPMKDILALIYACGGPVSVSNVAPVEG